MKYYNQITLPHTKLTSPTRIFPWSPEADQVFPRLKALFSTTPIPTHPNTSKQFTVQVDSADTSAGAVLSHALNVTFFTLLTSSQSSLVTHSVRCCHWCAMLLKLFIPTIVDRFSKAPTSYLLLCFLQPHKLPLYLSIMFSDCMGSPRILSLTEGHSLSLTCGKHSAQPWE